MPQSLAQILVHLVFSTKNREALLADDIGDELHGYHGCFALSGLGSFCAPNPGRCPGLSHFAPLGQRNGAPNERVCIKDDGPISPFGALAGPDGAKCESPGCNPGFGLGINPSALKGPHRAKPKFAESAKLQEAIKANLRGLSYGG